jgi:hypothetical protein
MEPRRGEPKYPGPLPEEKCKRFRIVKLEERIAPTKGGTTGGNSAYTCRCIYSICKHGSCV